MNGGPVGWMRLFCSFGNGPFLLFPADAGPPASGRFGIDGPSLATHDKAEYFDFISLGNDVSWKKAAK